MSDPVDIAVLPGMTPAWQAALRRLDFHSSADLLRANRRALVEAMPTLPVSQLREWQAYAQFLELAGISPQICGALLAAGIGSLDELSSRRLTQLQPLAAAAGLTMTDDSLVALLQDAVRLKHLGVLNVNVADADGQPLADVIARCDGLRATSDARGRLRFVRLRLGVPLTLELIHAMLGVKIVKGLRAVPLTALQGVKVAFPRRPTLPRPLSASRGDTLPALGSAPMTTAMQTGLPANNDVLRLIDRYTNGDARMASRFFDYVDGHFVVRTYRMPPTLVPAALEPGDDLRHDGTHWVGGQISAGRIARLQRLRSVKRPWPDTATPSVAALDRYVKQLLKTASD